MGISDQGHQNKRHFLLKGFAAVERFKRPRQTISPLPIPLRDRQLHGQTLLSQIDAIKIDMEIAFQSQKAAGLEDSLGLQIEFESFPDIEMAFESLSRERSKIELLNVRHENNMTYATVLVPEGKLAHFEGLIQDYLTEKRDRRGHSRDHKSLINAIQQIRTATIHALWTDDKDAFPSNDEDAIWWEVWLPLRPDRSHTIKTFRSLANKYGLRVASEELFFPERAVLLVFASMHQLKSSIMTINCIAELRRAKETADFFDRLHTQEQSAWVNDLLQRTSFPVENAPVPYICILDTGVNNGHPLITPVLSTADMHTIEPLWDINDSDGHGTNMAGLALIGDLTQALESTIPLEIMHRIESVKLLNENGGNAGDPMLHGYLTTEAVARPEITAPHRQRVFCMAVTARDNRDRGRPSAWSAAIDRLAADVDGDNARPRLIVISAGNVYDSAAWQAYPESNSSDSIHDPGQAWNALTVGAYTELINLVEPGDYQVIAPEGGLSPFSTTSAIWEPHWPYKPDVVFEGGNAAKDGIGAYVVPSLSLLTSHHLPAERLFATINATSSATALASLMAVQLMTTYPNLWPETIRALMVHSAEWTSSMRRLFLPQDRQPSKKDYALLVRHCGFGVPNLNRALWSVENSLTMVIEEELQPFMRESSQEPTLMDMHLHRLPWPMAELEALGERPVTMRITLSYFIEPNPSHRGHRSRYRYESHGLRFDVKRPFESEDEFRARINAAARDDGIGSRVGGDDTGWLIGKNNRHRGSLHSDLWSGTAADLASRGCLAIYPSPGWWKTRYQLNHFAKKTKYALIISIMAPEIDINLYTAVANQIPVSVPIES